MSTKQKIGPSQPVPSIPYHRRHEHFNTPNPPPPTLLSEIPKCSTPHALWIPKSLSPPPLRNFWFFPHTLWNSCLTTYITSSKQENSKLCYHSPSPCLQNSSQKNSKALELHDAARGMVWIFSGMFHNCPSITKTNVKINNLRLLTIAGCNMSINPIVDKIWSLSILIDRQISEIDKSWSHNFLWLSTLFNYDWFWSISIDFNRQVLEIQKRVQLLSTD